MPPAIDAVYDPLPMQAKTYPSFGKCIYCLEVFPPSELTDEHIVPLQLEGSMIIEKACCEPCRKMSNTFEHKAMYADLLVPRIILRLKRARRKSTPPSLPPAILNPSDGYPEEQALEKETVLAVEQYPPTLQTIGLPRAGILAGIERGDSLTDVRMHHAETGKPWSPPAAKIATRHLHDHTAMALSVLKIAYCFAVAERGLDGFDTRPVLDILTGKRSDIYNFVGMEPAQQIRRRRHLHFLSIKTVQRRIVVYVYLLGGYGTPVYEVVLEESQPQQKL
ncbi:HNH endonuclease [Rhizobium ruizarguesonis]|uniref:HNH endonuclease n=1 Tax=Rhizobium ruizarguesonis TaxID=2081791 RepID=UPI0013BB4484|nr:HNH endonuclease [Rhizobium ruizarguesonis]NEI07817.1 hypothetical protein [Rhizobium ruizarguesonis]